MRRLPFLALSWVLVLTTAAWCQERAQVADRPATWERDPQGRLGYHVGEASPLTLLRTDRHVRFPSPESNPSLPGAVHTVHLGDGQRVTGRILDWQAQDIRLTTGWGEVRVPLPAVEAVTWPPGWITRVAEDFEENTDGWMLQGGARITDQEKLVGSRSLRLAGAGQEAVLELQNPGKSGRLTVPFHVPARLSGGRWRLEAMFRTGQQALPLGIEIRGAEPQARMLGAGNTDGTVLPLTAGWHQLQFRFAPGLQMIGLDGRVVFEGDRRDAVPTRLAFRCDRVPDEPAAGAVCVDALTLAEAIDVTSHPPGDPGQDEVWTAAGDQLFGQLEAANGGSVRLKLAGGVRVWSWSRLRGVFPRRRFVEPRSSRGEHGRVRLHSGDGWGFDDLEGVLLPGEQGRLLLEHPDLGRLSLLPESVAEVSWSFDGSRQELWNAPHYLGDPERVGPPLSPPPRLEGPECQWDLFLEQIPARVTLKLLVDHLKGSEDLGDSLRRGERCLEVRLNDRHVGVLNRLVRRATASPRLLVVDLPAEWLRVGRNRLGLRQTPDGITGRREGAIVERAWLEVAKP